MVDRELPGCIYCTHVLNSLMFETIFYSITKTTHATHDLNRRDCDCDCSCVCDLCCGHDHAGALSAAPKAFRAGNLPSWSPWTALQSSTCACSKTYTNFALYMHVCACACCSFFTWWKCVARTWEMLTTQVTIYSSMRKSTLSLLAVSMDNTSKFTAHDLTQGCITYDQQLRN